MYTHNMMQTGLRGLVGEEGDAHDGVCAAWRKYYVLI